MATNEQKGFCVLQFAKMESVVIVRRLLRIKFGYDPPGDYKIRASKQTDHSELMKHD